MKGIIYSANIGAGCTNNLPLMFVPKLKFRIDPEKDIKTFWAFANDASFDAGRNLKWAVFKYYPQFRKYWINGKMKIDRSEIKSFVELQYSKKYKTMSKNLKRFQINWEKVESNFYHLARELFGKRNWPNGKYIAYPTIWAMFPRFLADKTFQIPYQQSYKKRVNGIIAHEMLHFIFYEYLFQKYPSFKKDKHEYFVWHVSEIINVVVQNSPVWLKVFKAKASVYPEHRKIVSHLSRVWYRRRAWDIDVLIDEVIKEVRDKRIIVSI